MFPKGPERCLLYGNLPQKHVAKRPAESPLAQKPTTEGCCEKAHRNICCTETYHRSMFPEGPQRVLLHGNLLQKYVAKRPTERPVALNPTTEVLPKGPQRVLLHRNLPQKYVAKRPTERPLALNPTTEVLPKGPQRGLLHRNLPQNHKSLSQAAYKEQCKGDPYQSYLCIESSRESILRLIQAAYKEQCFSAYEATGKASCL